MMDIFELEAFVFQAQEHEVILPFPDGRICILQHQWTPENANLWDATLYEEDNSHPYLHLSGESLDALIHTGKSYSINLLALLRPNDPVTREEYESIVTLFPAETQVLSFQEEGPGLTYEAGRGTIFIPLSLFQAAIKTYQEQFRFGRRTALLRAAQVCSWDIWSADEQNVVHSYYV